MSRGVRLSPGKAERPNEDKILQIEEFWNRLRVCEEPGATTWDVLEPLEREVAEALVQRPPDLDRADAATAQALFRISGVDLL